MDTKLDGVNFLVYDYHGDLMFDTGKVGRLGGPQRGISNSL